MILVRVIYKRHSFIRVGEKKETRLVCSTHMLFPPDYSLKH